MNLSRKIIFFVLILFIIGISSLSAQGNKQGISASGIYMDSQDFNQGKLSYSFDCETTGKIELNDFLSFNYIDVTVAGKKNKLNKDSIYGYRNCKNETFRFYKKHDEEFQILEDNGIVIYLSYIRVSSNNGKNNQTKPEYFFSKTDNSEIIPLTIVNLKRAFPDNIKFHDMLDVEFGNGESLSSYSTSYGMHKINYLFNKSNPK